MCVYKWKKEEDFKEWSCMETEKLGVAHPAFRFFKKFLDCCHGN